MATKPFGDEVNFLGSAISMFSITKHDTNELPSVVRMIYVGGSGDVSVVDTRGNTVVHKGVSSGSYLGPFNVLKVTSTNTTATDLIGYV